MTFYRRYLIILSLLWLGIPISGWGQKTLDALTRDTIIRVPELFGSGYYMDGKRLNLSVMEWFMQDYPEAHIPIRGAVISDQLSLAAYATGGILLLTGVIIREDNLNVSNDLLATGMLSSGAGLVFHIIETSFKRTAVERYNLNIRNSYAHPEKFRVSVMRAGIGMSWQF